MERIFEEIGKSFDLPSTFKPKEPSVYQLIETVNGNTLGIFDSLEKAKDALLEKIVKDSRQNLNNKIAYQINKIPLNIVGRYSEQMNCVYPKA